jgi:hypothetical protein
MCDVEVSGWCGMGDGVIAFGWRTVASRYTYGIRIPIRAESLLAKTSM